MNKEFIPHQEALELKELGFNELCLEAYDKNGMLYHSHKTDKLFTALNSNLSTQCSAPLYQQAFRWFREKYGLEIILRPDAINAPEKKLREYVILSYDKSWILEPIAEPHWWIRKGCFKNPEEAELACLKKLIEIVKGGDK
jgi:hypothetical protein